jgi:hypothetical protein
MGDMLKGDERADSPDKALKMIAKGYQMYMPLLSQITNSQAMPFAQSELNTQKLLGPGVAKINNDIYQQYAPQYSQTQGRMEADRAAGSGADTVRSVEGLNRELNPEYYGSTAATGGKLQDLLAGMDPNKLTGAESTNVERGLNRMNVDSGGFNMPQSGTNAVKSALTFGGALDQKRNTVANAINTASQALPNLKTTGDTFTQATGRGQPTQFGQDFTGGPSSTSTQFGTNVLNGLTGLKNTGMNIDANRRTIADQVGQAWQQSGLGGAVSGGGGCCFIMMEAYYGRMPWFIRKCRDMYYTKQPQVAKGYKRMAKFLVPLMQRSNFIRELVCATMIAPITSYGGWLCGVKGYEHGKHSTGAKKFWFSVWNILGKI